MIRNIKRSLILVLIFLMVFTQTFIQVRNVKAETIISTAPPNQVNVPKSNTIMTPADVVQIPSENQATIQAPSEKQSTVQTPSINEGTSEPIPDEQAVSADKEALQIGFSNGDTVNSVTGDVYLPSIGSNLSSITWDSSEKGIISDTGVVTRPSFSAGDKEVTLTATLQKGDITNTKNFTLIVIKNNMTDAEAVTADKEALQIGFSAGDSLDSVTGNVTLPSSGANDTTITWTTSDDSLINTNGSVTRPEPTSDPLGSVTIINVTLTATLQKGEVTDTKSFSLKVIGLPTEGTGGSGGTVTNDQDYVYADLNALQIGYTEGDSENHVTQNLTLPTLGLNFGSTVTWHSSSPEVISTNGTVTRPSYRNGDNRVHLEAIITFGSAACTKSFDVTVLKNDIANDEDAVYADYEALQIGYGDGDNGNSITQNITLPIAGANGSTISWYSNNTAIINTDGTVTRPTNGSDDAYVNICATVTYGSATIAKWFNNLRVRQEDGAVQSSYDKAYADYVALQIGFAEGDNENSITHNLTLPTSGANGSTISWYSENTAIINTDGTVTRPSDGSGDAYVNICATVTCGSASIAKWFNKLCVVQINTLTDEASVQADTNDLQIGFSEGDNADSVTGNLVFPTSGANGSTVTWTSSDESIIKNDGTVTRPAFTAGNKTVTLTVTIRKGDAAQAKTFTLIVMRSDMTDSEEDKAYADYEALQIGYADGDSQDSVTRDVTLVTTGANGGSITWTSSDENTISTSGVVKRPEYSAGDKVVTLTATINMGSASQTKTFTLTVKYDPTDDHGYSFETASPITIGTPVSGSLDYKGDWDYFKFTVETSGLYSLKSISNMDTYGYLYDENGNYLSESDDDGGNGQFLISQSLEAGKTYYLAIRHYNNQTTGPYQVLVSPMSDTDSVNVDTADLQIEFTNGDNYDSVTQNLTLPSSGTYGSSITWSSSYDSIISSSGVVTRPGFTTGNIGVTLTATISKGDVTQTKAFTVTVLRLDMTDSEEDKARADFEALQIGYADGDNADSITQNITLPTSGAQGSTVTWYSENESIINTDGVVVRPSYSSGDAWVNLRATITNGSTTYNKDFNLHVLRSSDLVTDDDKCYADYEALQLGYAEGDYADSITQNITLPTSGEQGSTITWSSGNPDIISNDGTVTRPDYSYGSTWVWIQATITNGSATYNKGFELFVPRKDDIITDADKARADYDELQIGYAEGDYQYSVTQNITLPTSGSHGSSITWYSYNSDIICNDGTVIRPSYSGSSSYVYLRADVTSGSATYQRYYYLYVLKNNDIITDEDKARADYDELQIGYADGDNQDSVTQNITLPTSGSHGSSISWYSYDQSFISNDGIVTRPNYKNGDAWLTIRATITSGSSQYNKYFDLHILRNDIATDDDRAYADYDELQIGYAEGDSQYHVTQNLTLPTTGSQGSSITWYSYDNAVSPDGTVTRPSFINGDVSFWVYATITNGSAQYTKWFDVTVIKNDVATDEDAVYVDTQSLDIGYSYGDDSNYVTQNVTLQTTGTNGSSITWASSDENIINTAGIVNPPAYAEGDKSITLTATISKGTESSTKNFTLTVRRKAMTNSDEDLACSDMEAIQITYAAGDYSTSVTQNVTLPSSGANGSSITWSSNETSVINNDGTVTRPNFVSGDKTVTLTATVSKGNVTRTRDFTLIVIRDTTDDYGNNIATAYPITPGTPISGGIQVPGEYDYFKFTTDVASSCIIKSISNMDTYGYLFDENGNFLASNDDGGGNLQFYISRNLEAGKTYYVAIRNYWYDVTGPYQVLVTLTPLTDADYVRADRNALQIGYANGDAYNSVTQNITLPSTGAYGSSITWTSNDPSTVSDNGVVTRPPYASGDRWVYLTATIQKGTASDTRSFSILVKRSNVATDEDVVTADTESLQIQYASGDYEYSVTQNLTLSSSGTNGSSITWTSNDEGTVGTSGVVTRPSYKAGDKSVYLTATITKGTSSRTKSFYVYVRRNDITTDEDKVYADFISLQSNNIVYAAGDSQYNITQNIVLPLSGSNGSEISWSSSDESIINGSGVVMRPNYKVGNKYVILTATLRKGDATETLAFTLYVIKAESEYLEFNGHYYRVIDQSISWTDAKNEAEAMVYHGQHGYLATVSSAEENAFIVSMTNTYYHWFGGIQPEGSSEPAGGWQWVTGEPWGYQNWNWGEPNDSGNEDALAYWTDDGRWNDYPRTSSVSGYIVEFDNPNPQVTITNPVNSAADIAQEKVITVTFDKAIEQGEDYDSILVKDSEGNSISIDKNISNHVLTITPKPYLSFGTVYTVIIPAQSIQSEDDNGMTADYSFSFTTVANDAEYNGHYYRVINKNITWADAKKEAEALTHNGVHGHLATVTSEEENDFIFNLGDTLYHWLGGIQPYGSNEPDGNWQWITGEDMSYINWAIGQPSNSTGFDPKGENAIEYFDNHGEWNDWTAVNVPRNGYIVEFDDTLKPAVPEVTETNPVKGAADANQDQSITITFNVNISQGTDYDNIIIKDSSSNALSIDKVFNGKVLTLTPKPYLRYDTVYTVVIPAQAILNVDGNSLAADYSFSFTTADKWDHEAPVITQVTPATGLTMGGDSSQRLQVNFTENDTCKGARVEIEASINGVDWQSVGDVQGPLDSGTGFYYVYCDWNLHDVASGQYTVRYTVYDRSGNASNPKNVIYQIDRTGPGSPQNLTTDFDASGIKLDWQAPSDADTAVYNIYRQTVNEGEFTVISTTYGRNNTTFIDGSIQPGKTYNYKVIAIDNYRQEGTASNVSTIEINSDTTNPVILGIEPAEGSTIGPMASITVRAQDNFILSSITLQYSVGDSGAWIDIATIPTRNTATFEWNSSPLTGNVKVRAIAKDFVGLVSDGTSIRNYTIDTTGPDEIQGLNATSSTTSIVLRWTDVTNDDFAYYQIERKDTPDGEFHSIATTSSQCWWNAAGLSPDTSYTFRVVGYDKYGNRGTAADVEAATVSDTSAPSITGISPMPASFSNRIPLSGSARDNVGITTFTFQYSMDNGTSWIDIVTLNPDGIPANAYVSYNWDVSGLSEGKMTVRAVATDAAGNHSNISSSASTVEYMIDHSAPVIPTGLTLTPTSGDITLTWNKAAESDLHHYQVYRSIDNGSSYTLYADNVSSLTAPDNQMLIFVDNTLTPGVTYFYGVKAVDSAGNISEMSEPKSGTLLPDTENPKIISISPVAESTLAANPNVGVLASDNYKLSKVTLEYQKEGDSDWTLIEAKDLNVNNTVSVFTWNTIGLTDGRYTLRATAQDKSGLKSIPTAVTYNLNVAPPAVPVLTLTPGNWQMNLSWTTNNEEDLAGFRIYRATTPGGSYTRIAERSKGTTTYTDEMLKPGYTYYYMVEALDIYSNSNRSAAVSERPLSIDTYAPAAEAGDDQTIVVNTEAGFDATQSKDNDQIASYHWDFGDGSTSNIAKPAHVYTTTGSFTATLTVTDAAGNQDTDTSVVTVKDAEQVGTLEVQVVDDSTGAALADASVVIQFPDGTMQKFITNGYGKATTAVTPGEFQAYAYKTDYKPASTVVSISKNTRSTATIRLKQGKLVVGELTVRRLTLSEIEAAGINTSAPENQWVYKFEVHLAFNNQPLPTSTFYTNPNGIIGTPQPIVIGDGGGGGGSGPGGSIIAYPVAIPHPEHPEVRPTIAYMVIPGEARWLKEFFEVGLSLENDADQQFIIADSQATLRLPDGLSLAPTKEPQSLTVGLGDIAGQETREVKWIIRGDKKGYYSLSADFNGILKPFDDPVKATFTTTEPFRVWGDDAIKMHIDAQDRAIKGSPYHVRFGIENVSDVPVYNVAIELKDDTKQNYIYAPNQELEKMVRELPAGQTMWADYWLIPSITGTLDLSHSFVLKTGENDVNIPTVITSHSDPENYPPDVPVLYQIRTSDGKVNLTWDDVSGAQGYKIYSVRSDLYMSKDPELVYTAGPTEHSVTLTETQGEKDYAITTIIPADGDATIERLKHAVTGLSWCNSAGNPVITIDPMQINVGKSSDLMITVNHQGFPVKQGTIDVGNYVTGQPLDANGQTRVTVIPTENGDLVVSAYDRDHNFLVSKTIKVVGDLIAPAVPVGLHAVSDNGVVSLAWDANTEEDLAGYNVYEYVNASWSKVNATLITRAGYTIPGIQSGNIHRYKVSAVDLYDNESEKSATAYVGKTDTINTVIDITQEDANVSETTGIKVLANAADSAINVGSILNAPSAGTVATAPLPHIDIDADTSISEMPVTVQIPQGTVIHAPETWNGTINVPTIMENNTVTVTPGTGKTAEVNSVIEVGYGDVPLTMNKAFRILIPGQAGKNVGYVRGGTFTRITASISADNQDAADREIPEGGDAAIDVGADKVIWTKHLTKFVTFTETVVATPPDTLTFSYFNLTGANGSAFVFNGPSDSVVDSSKNLYVTDYYNNRIVEFDSTGKLLHTFGTQGSGVGQFYKPTGIAIDKDDTIYVADTYNNRIVRFKDTNNNGTLESGEWQVWGGTTGSGKLQFNKPMGVYVKGSTVYAVDTYNYRIAVFDKSDADRTWKTFGAKGAENGNFNLPYDVVVDSQDNIWVSDTFNNRVQELNKNGQFVVKFASAYPYGITVDSSDIVFVVERQSGLVKAINNPKTYGGKGTTAGTFTSPICINADAMGQLWVVDVTASKVQRASIFPNTLSFSYANLTGTNGSAFVFNGPSDSVVDSSKNLYVTDYYNNRVVEFDSTGKLLHTFGTQGSGIGQFYKPTGIAIDKDDNIYVADTYNNRIVRFKDANNNGTFESGEWQVWGGTTGSGKLQFNKPMGVYVKGSTVYAVDTYNYRIAVFDKSDADGTWKTFGVKGAENGNFNLPYDVVVDSQDNIWVSDTFNNRIQEFDKNGQFITKFASAYPYGITIDSRDNVIVVERQSGLVKVINNAKTYGGKGTTAGTFTSPIGINVDAFGILWVVDVTAGKVQWVKFVP